MNCKSPLAVKTTSGRLRSQAFKNRLPRGKLSVRKKLQSDGYNYWEMVCTIKNLKKFYKKLKVKQEVYKKLKVKRPQS